jgi:Domain of unknown function (DUF929)
VRRGGAAMVALLVGLVLVPVAHGAARPTPLAGLRQARSALAGLAAQVRSPAVRGRLGASAAALGRASAPSLWLDPQHVVAPLYGLSVFVESRAALLALERVPAGSVAPARLAAIEAQILASDRAVAEGSIRQALHGPGGLLARARGMVLSGDRWAVTSRFDLGAEQYGAGWRDAFQALTNLVITRATLLPAGALSAGAQAALSNPRVAPAGVRSAGGRPGLARARKPEVLFVGTETCRFCAVERWGLVAALSQFGMFSNLHLSQSTSTIPPVVRSFTFAGASYRSPYLSFVSVEVSGEAPRAGGGYQPLESLTGAQRGLLRALDPRGVVPFVDVANRVLDVGATVSPSLLGGSSWTPLVASLRHAGKPAGQAIAASAEVLTAEICAVTGGAPASVCGSAVVQDYSRRLAQFGSAAGGCPVPGRRP